MEFLARNSGAGNDPGLKLRAGKFPPLVGARERGKADAAARVGSEYPIR